MNAVTATPSTVPSSGPMKLYIAPLACSLASRIACYEAGIDVEYVEVDTAKKRVVDGGDFYAINPMGQVPVLEVAEGVRLLENAAVLQFLADRVPSSDLAPADGFGRARLQQWLGFIGTELHKAVFIPLLDKSASAAAKDEARGRLARRMDFVEQHLAAHDHLLDRFSVADAYLVAILNWTAATAIDLAAWPAVQRYHRRLLQRPRLAAAFGDELALYQAERRRAAATA